MNQLIEGLVQAYLGESQARNRYTLYAKITKNEGYEQINNIFLETADHEKTHGKNYFWMIQKVMGKLGEKTEMLELNNVGVLVVHGTAIENLKAGIAGEHHEFSELYPAIAKTAEEEGFVELAVQITSITTAKNHHETRYAKLLKQLEESSFHKKDGKVWWFCMECGWWDYTEEAPNICPSCNHPKGYFKKIDEDTNIFSFFYFLCLLLKIRIAKTLLN